MFIWYYAKSECHQLTAVFTGFFVFVCVLSRYVPVFGQVPPVCAGSGFPPVLPDAGSSQFSPWPPLPEATQNFIARAL